jgi:hypothetical protein
MVRSLRKTATQRITDLKDELEEADRACGRRMVEGPTAHLGPTCLKTRGFPAAGALWRGPLRRRGASFLGDGTSWRRNRVSYRRNGASWRRHDVSLKRNHALPRRNNMASFRDDVPFGRGDALGGGNIVDLQRRDTLTPQNEGLHQGNDGLERPNHVPNATHRHLIAPQ